MRSVNDKPTRPSLGRTIGAFGGFVAMSAVAALLVTAAVTPAIAVTGMAANDGINTFDDLPSYLQISQLQQRTTLTVKAADGTITPLATFFAQNREEVEWDAISQSVKDAAVAAEDPRFYEHGGVDLIGTARAVLSTVVKGNVQGGSSITQQLVKNVLLQQCEGRSLAPKPDPADVPAKPDKTKYSDDASYQKDLAVYDTAEKKYEADRKSYDADQKWYDNCVTDSTGVSPARKLREMKLAIGLEKKYTKEQILLKYLNIAGFGGTVYGIEAAAQYYYGIHAKDLDLSQAASLMAIVNNPNNLRIDDPSDPANGAKNGYQANKDRRNYVLDKMLAATMITKAEHDAATKAPVEPHITPTPRGCQAAGSAGNFCDYVTWVIKNDPAFGKTADERYANFEQGGYTIQTTLDPGLQQVAAQSLTSVIPTSIPQANLGAATTSVQAGTGRILTMAQSRPFSDDGDFLSANPTFTAVNWNTNKDYGGSSGFPAGSTYKIFTLDEWLKTGHALNDTVNASKHAYPAGTFHNSCGPTGDTWNVANDESNETGTWSVMAGTAHSVNTVFAQMATQLDLCNIKNDAMSFDMQRADGQPLETNPSSVIGTNEVSPLNEATAMAGVANGGVVCTPIAIDKITGPDGKDVPAPKSTCTPAVTPQIAAAMEYALHGVMIGGGTATASNPGDGTNLIGKTGTSDENWHTWSVVASSAVSTATWVGNVSGGVDLRNLYLGGHQVATLRHNITKPIVAAADATYGGTTFPAPDRSYIVGVQIPVPDLTGQSPAQAQTTLEALGLVYADGGSRPGSQAVGTVTATSPAAGTGVSKSETITVYTSSGAPAPTPTPTPGAPGNGQGGGGPGGGPGVSPGGGNQGGGH